MVINDAARRAIVEALQTEMEEGQVRGLLKALEALPEADIPEAATLTELGTVKMAEDPGELAGGATLGDVINAFNFLVQAMKEAGQITESF